MMQFLRAGLLSLVIVACGTQTARAQWWAYSPYRSSYYYPSYYYSGYSSYYNPSYYSSYYYPSYYSGYYYPSYYSSNYYPSYYYPSYYAPGYAYSTAYFPSYYSASHYYPSSYWASSYYPSYYWASSYYPSYYPSMYYTALSPSYYYIPVALTCDTPAVRPVALAGTTQAQPTPAPASQSKDQPSDKKLVKAGTDGNTRLVSSGNSTVSRSSDKIANCQVGFWNVSQRDVTMTIDGRKYTLPRNRSVTLTLGHSFMWQVDGRAAESVRIADNKDMHEIVIR